MKKFIILLFILISTKILFAQNDSTQKNWDAELEFPLGVNWSNFQNMNQYLKDRSINQISALQFFIGIQASFRYKKSYLLGGMAVSTPSINANDDTRTTLNTGYVELLTKVPLYEKTQRYSIYLLGGVGLAYQNLYVTQKINTTQIQNNATNFYLQNYWFPIALEYKNNHHTIFRLGYRFSKNTKWTMSLQNMPNTIEDNLDNFFFQCVFVIKK